MYQPSFRSVAAALSGRLPRPGLSTAVFGARLLLAFAVPSHLLAHEAHPTAQPATTAVVDEAPFLKENDDAMTKMMSDMAISELRYGKNEQLRRIAQEIIVDQMQEIGAMKLAIGEPVTESAPAPTQQQPASTPVEHHHSGMQMDMSSGMKH